ncbi:4'-phosphopantetheinyl transferase family protein [Brumimicrobium mesophilum]|uniref:4'-phosphopantetheinyl transferase family protein n=1 Tax=Brumimicrobium mesophilum TaxID=392717 RepID=UPI000D1408BF|nr:4'-phosphopantetheinyl transferase superfamily protein [Brumimicrobium mesophilum]
MFHTEKINYGPVSVFLLYYDDFVTEEHLHNLLPSEHKKLESLNHSSRRREYVATRVLRTMHFGNEPILYSEIGAPYVEGEGFISISHANHVVGMAYCETFQVGLDLEPINEKVMRVKHKFLSAEEERLTNTSSVEEMIKVWSGKEALYKLAGRKKIIFAESLLLTRINEQKWKGRIYFPDNKKEVELILDVKDNFVISINPSPVYEVN